MVFDFQGIVIFRDFAIKHAQLFGLVIFHNTPGIGGTAHEDFESIVLYPHRYMFFLGEQKGGSANLLIGEWGQVWCFFLFKKLWKLELTLLWWTEEQECPLCNSPFFPQTFRGLTSAVYTCWCNNQHVGVLICFIETEGKIYSSNPVNSQKLLYHLTYPPPPKFNSEGEPYRKVTVSPNFGSRIIFLSSQHFSGV